MPPIRTDAGIPKKEAEASTHPTNLLEPEKEKKRSKLSFLYGNPSVAARLSGPQSFFYPLEVGRVPENMHPEMIQIPTYPSLRHRFTPPKWFHPTL